MKTINDFININNNLINYTLHLPRNRNTKCAVVLCHGLSGDKVGPGRILVELGNYLSENGIAVLRFDFLGSGDSEGSFEDITFSRMVNDTIYICNYLQEEYKIERVGILGFSIGGLVAIYSALKIKICQAIVLWNTEITDDFKIELNKPLYPIRNGAFYVKQNFYEERLKLKPKTDTLDLSIPLLLLVGEKDQKVLNSAKHLNTPTISIKILRGVDHLFERTEQRKEVIDLTYEWFKILKSESDYNESDI